MSDGCVVVVLAGGRATRMGGGDKALVPFGGSTLLDHVLARVTSRPVVLSANGDPARFARFGLPVLMDTLPDFPGPLAGVLAGMEWTRDNASGAAEIVTVPVDTPFLPLDLLPRLRAARGEMADMACAASAGRAHNVCALWPVRLAPSLRRALVAERLRKVGLWTARFRCAHAVFGTDPVDPFFNVNTLEDLAAAEAMLTP